MCWNTSAQSRGWGRWRRVRGAHKVFVAQNHDDTTTTTTTTTST
jgi:hypothetical protein